MTKKERIRGFLALGWSVAAIAEEVGCSLQYVRVTRATPPGYHAEWVRQKRARNPAFCAKERRWQRDYRRRKRAEASP